MAGCAPSPRATAASARCASRSRGGASWRWAIRRGRGHRIRLPWRQGGIDGKYHHPAASQKGGSPPTRPRAKSAPAPPRVLVMVATRKGAWFFQGDSARRSWRVDGPHFLGHIISHVVLDPRDGRTLPAAAKTGHLGPTIFRSTDLGRRWK